MLVGDTARLTVSTEPEGMETVFEWSSVNQDIASVSQDGEVIALSPGETEIIVSAGELSASATVTVVLPDPKVGDYFYSDGTWSTELEEGRTVIGVVFWLGNPTASDPVLKADFPECTHGLVVAAGGDVPATWQENYGSAPCTVGDWVAENMSGYLPVNSDTEETSPLNNIQGYNNTKALETYNAASENSEWLVGIVSVVQSYRTEVPAPANTSGWYIPSMKELSLLCSGENEGNVYDIAGDSDMRDLVNGKLEAVDAVQLSSSSFYWSSTENGAEYAFDIDFSEGSVYLDLKFMSDPVRCVLAF